MRSTGTAPLLFEVVYELFFELFFEPQWRTEPEQFMCRCCN